MLRACFLNNETGIQRRFELPDFLGQGDVIEFGTDASMWGLGGWASANGKIIFQFSDKISEEDAAIYGISTCHPDGQQVWESLAILVVVRL